MPVLSVTKATISSYSALYVMLIIAQPAWLTSPYAIHVILVIGRMAVYANNVQVIVTTVHLRIVIIVQEVFMTMEVEAVMVVLLTVQVVQLLTAAIHVLPPNTGMLLIVLANHVKQVVMFVPIIPHVKPVNANPATGKMVVLA